MKNISNSEKRVNILRRTAKETIRYRTTMKVLRTALVLLVILASVLYASSALYKNAGSFTISVDKFEMTKYGLTLSETKDMKYQTSHLSAEIAEEITNIAGESIPDNVDMIDGVHNGDNYIAYTFYLQNAGEAPISYEYSVNMSNITNALDEAIRLKLYVDGTATTYAKTSAAGSGAEPGTVEFYSANVMARGRMDGFEPGEITKFTVVIWIEGNDPECVDWLIGGEMYIDMTMSIIH